jgi:hypothetical protein
VQLPLERTGRDKVGDARALLEERLVVDILEELVAEVLHLKQADPHDGRLGVVCKSGEGSIVSSHFRSS